MNRKKRNYLIAVIIVINIIIFSLPRNAIFALDSDSGSATVQEPAPVTAVETTTPGIASGTNSVDTTIPEEVPVTNAAEEVIPVESTAPVITLHERLK